MKRLFGRHRVRHLMMVGSLLVGPLVVNVAAAQPASATDCLPSATSPGAYLGCVVNSEIQDKEQQVYDTVAEVQGTVLFLYYAAGVIVRCWTGGGC